MILVLAACAEWPRFEHLEREDTGGSPPAGVQIAENPIRIWTDIRPRAESEDDSPTSAPVEDLAVNQGIRLVGRIAGSGWAADGVSARPECAGVPAAFPTEPTGEYLGDVDWRLIEVGSPGVLCSSLAAAAPEFRVDVLAFELDACGLPAKAFTGLGDLVVGFSPSTATNQWGIRLDAPGRYALVGAAWAPNAPDDAAAYSWGVALLPSDSELLDCEGVWQ